MVGKMEEARAAVKAALWVALTAVETEGEVTTGAAETGEETARCTTRHRAWRVHHSLPQPEACTHGDQTHTQMRHARWRQTRSCAH